MKEFIIVNLKYSPKRDIQDILVEVNGVETYVKNQERKNGGKLYFHPNLIEAYNNDHAVEEFIAKHQKDEDEKNEYAMNTRKTKRYMIAVKEKNSTEGFLVLHSEMVTTMLNTGDIRDEFVTTRYKAMLTKEEKNKRDVKKAMNSIFQE